MSESIFVVADLQGAKRILIAYATMNAVIALFWVDVALLHHGAISTLPSFTRVA